MANISKNAFQVSTPLSVKLQNDKANTPANQGHQSSGQQKHIQPSSLTSNNGVVLTKLIERIKTI